MPFPAPIAAAPLPPWLPLAAAAAAAVTVAWGAAELVRFMTAARADHLRSPHEVERRRGLRAAARVYRWFEPLVDRLAARHAAAAGARVDKLGLDLAVAPPHPTARWKPEEYLATRQLTGVGYAALFVAVMLLLGAPPLGVLFAAGVGYAAWEWRLMLGKVRKAAAIYRADVRARLPYAVELMALMVEAGSSDVNDAMPEVVAENRGHPLGTEFGRVIGLTGDGMPLTDALQGMADRLRDEAVSELAATIRTADRAGGPGIQATLRNLAEQMRTQRVQRLERAAEEAKLHMTWPGMGAMLACLIVAAAPFVLSGWYSVNQ